jgi:membrane-bound inhibitor of C-type lysozyme
MKSTRTVLILLVVIIVIALGVWWFLGKKPSGSIVQNDQTIHYVCLNNKTIDATFSKGGPTAQVQPGEQPTPTGYVALKLSDGRSLNLPQTISGSGIRYGNKDESIIFWSKGNGAFVLENNQQTYMGCVSVATDPGGLPGVFSSGSEGFSIRYPQDYTVTEGYKYQELGPGRSIGGVKFTIPTALAQGTNLGNDSYFSVESIASTTSCDASLFLDGAKSRVLLDNGTNYSFASSTGAGAGNRYEEWVYAFPGTNPCTAVRYFIHYGVIENYPTGSTKEFDKGSLLKQFDAMRLTLTLI